MPEEAPNQNQEKPKKMLLDRVDMIVGGVFAVLIVATGVAMFTVDSSYLYGDGKIDGHRSIYESIKGLANKRRSTKHIALNRCSSIGYMWLKR